MTTKQAKKMKTMTTNKRNIRWPLLGATGGIELERVGRICGKKVVRAVRVAGGRQFGKKLLHA